MKHSFLAAIIALIAAWTFHHTKYLIAIYFGNPLLTALLVSALIMISLLLNSKRAEALSRELVERFPCSRLIPAITGLALLLLLPARRLEEPPVGPGDSLHLVEFIPVFSELYGYLSTPDELLELFVRSKLFLLLQTETEARSAIGLYSYFAGLLHITAAFLFLRNRKDWKSGWLILFFTPVMALYAGYVESYSMARGLLFATMVISWTAINQSDVRSRDRWVLAAAATAALAVLHHLLAGLILPALIYMVWKTSGGEARVFLRRSVVAGLVGICIVSGVYIAFFLSPQASLVFADSHVGTEGMMPVGKLLSPGNLSKMAGLLFIVPAFLIPILSKTRPGAKNNQDLTIERFLWVSTLPFLLHAFLWNAAIGMPADWDLFTFFAIPLSLLVFHRLSRVQLHRKAKAVILPLLTVLPALLWLHWLNETSPATLKNGQYISYVKSDVIPALKNDKLLARLPINRQKLYLRLRLFEEKARFNMARLPVSPDRQKAEQNLVSGMQIFHSGLLESDAVYEEKIVETQKFLFPVYQFLRAQQSE